MTALAILLALQSSEQALEQFRKASEHVERGAFAEGLRLCEELVKLRPDKEGMLRVRVGAGLEDRPFEPRRLAGDACLRLARNAADLETRLRHLDEALRWYKASADLGLEKSKGLLETARGEKEKAEKEMEGARGAELVRRKVEAVKKEVAERVVKREFEPAFEALDKAVPDFKGNEAALEALRSDLKAEFLRWHDGLVTELRRDLEGLRPERALQEPSEAAKRFSRYRVPPEQAAPSRLEPFLGWGARLGALFERAPLDAAAAQAAAEEGLAFGVVAWRAAEGLALETLASRVKDPGASEPLDRRWESVTRAREAFAAAAGRAREKASAAAKEAGPAVREELNRWMAEDLAGFERRVAEVAKGLPDREAPAAIGACLARLDDPSIAAGARGAGYQGMEKDLQEILSRSRVQPADRSRALAGAAAARAYALFLEGLTREQVLEKCRDLAGEAHRSDASAVETLAARVSPRVGWVLRQAKP
jgi:hypothetical protein